MAKTKATTPTCIKSIEHLIEYLAIDNEENDPKDFFINLGGMRSSKSIQYLPTKKGAPRFAILNEIDDTRQTLSKEQLYIKSNIGYSIDHGNFYAY